jgi:hypothetical protein
MIGGTISSTLLTLIVNPAIYGVVKGWNLRHVGAPVTKPGGTSTSMRRYIILGFGPRQWHLTPFHS